MSGQCALPQSHSQSGQSKNKVLLYKNICGFGRQLVPFDPCRRATYRCCDMHYHFATADWLVFGDQYLIVFILVRGVVLDFLMEKMK